MPIPYIENIRRWTNEAEVDYFTYFIKAWIPFNAWFRNHYDENHRERDIIDYIKSDGNVVRSRIIRLLGETDAEAEAFREHLAQLHARLERHTLTNRGNLVTFTGCYVGLNPATRAADTHNGVSYHIERGTPGHASLTNNHVLCELTRTGGASIFRKTQPRYDPADLQADTAFVALSPQRRVRLESLYKTISPRLDVNLLDTSGGHIGIGVYQFCNNPSHIFAGMVENIYSLRCLLFHGEVVPTSEINGVYESAYHILRRFLRSIV